MDATSVGNFSAANKALSPVAETPANQSGGGPASSGEVAEESRGSQTPPPPPTGALAQEENTSQDHASSGKPGEHRVDIRV